MLAAFKMGAFAHGIWLRITLLIGTAGLCLSAACSSSSDPSGGPDGSPHGGDGAGVRDRGGSGEDARGGTPSDGESGPSGKAGEGSNAGESNGAAGDGAAGGGDSGRPPEDDTSLWSLTPHASPLTVTYTVETASSVTKAIPLGGGTLTTTGADGTKFQLSIPADALVSPETISMAPIKVTEPPFGDGPVWGVQLLPDGLYFNQAVKLVITPPPAELPPVVQQLPFGWSGQANQIMLAAPDPKDAKLSIMLLHFSSYAYATARTGFSASLAGVRARIGGSAELRMQSAAAEVLIKERQTQLLGAPETGLESWGALQRLMEEYENEVVKPRIAAAGSSCAAGRLALETSLSFERQKALLGFPTESTLPFVQLMEVIIPVCLDEEWALCRDAHIVQRLIPVYLGLEKQAQLLGADTSQPTWRAKALEYISKCHKYRLEVTTKATSVCDEWTFSENMSGEVALTMSSIDSPIMGSDTLFSVGYSMNYARCASASNVVPVDTTLLVNSLDWNLNTDPREPGKGEIADFTLRYFPLFGSGSTHVMHDTCGKPPAPPQTVAQFNWGAIYGIATYDNPAYFDGTGWYFENWQVSNGSATLAKKTIAPVVDDGGIVYGAPTSLVLVHTPG